MWITIGKKHSNKVKPLSRNHLTVHKVSSGKNRYFRLCFPRALACGAESIKFSRDGERKIVAVIADSSRSSDSFHVSIDKRVNKKYVTFKAGEISGVKPGKYFASIPWSQKEGPVLPNERVLFYLHPAK